MAPPRALLAAGLLLAAGAALAGPLSPGSPEDVGAREAAVDPAAGSAEADDCARPPPCAPTEAADLDTPLGGAPPALDHRPTPWMPAS